MMRALLIACCVATAAPVFADATAPSPARATDRGEVIALAEPIAFRPGTVEIVAGSRRQLDALAVLLENTPSLLAIEIQVHSDARGAAEYNLKTSEGRAQAIRTYLIGRGIKAERLRAKGYGESKPICNQPTAACFAKNRRVEIHVIARASASPQRAAKRSQ
jgi:outer membrane protein OmpA-like peptidoglycan-associated protein